MEDIEYPIVGDEDLVNLIDDWVLEPPLWLHLEPMQTLVTRQHAAHQFDTGWKLLAELAQQFFYLESLGKTGDADISHGALLL